MLCGPLGGEAGKVFLGLLGQFGMDGSSVEVAHRSPVVINDRRSGERVTIADSPVISLERHEIDDVYVNVPAVGVADVASVHWADLDAFGYFRVATADVADRRIQFVVGASEGHPHPGTDTVLCSENNVTVTPPRTIEPAAFPGIAASEVLAMNRSSRT